MGSGSMQLARIFGIRIGVNASWFLVLFLFVFLLTDTFSRALGGDQTAAYLTAVAASLLFFGSIVLHELGHALAARREGIHVAGIDLFFFGGLMRMRRDTDTPGAEFRVAAAGPAVTVLIVLAAGLAGVALAGSFDGFLERATLDPSVRSSIPELLVSFLVLMNIALLLLNLVPAFPLDGGRIARAVAWKVTGDRVRATRISAWLGQGFAWVLIAYGVLLALRGNVISGVWLAVLGWLLGSAARAAVTQTRFSERLRGITVAEIMDPDPVAIPAGTPVARVWDEYFLRYQGSSFFPVIDGEGRPVGVVHRAPVDDLIRAEQGDIPVEQALSEPEPGGEVGASEPLESLVGSPELRERGALLALDADGRLAGVVTLQQVSRALSAQLGTT